MLPRTVTGSWPLNPTKVFFSLTVPSSLHSSSSQQCPGGTNLHNAVPELTSLFSSLPCLKGKLRNSWACAVTLYTSGWFATAGATTSLGELPPWGSSFVENKDEQCCTYCFGSCISYSNQLFLLCISSKRLCPSTRAIKSAHRAGHCCPAWWSHWRKGFFCPSSGSTEWAPSVP